MFSRLNILLSGQKAVWVFFKGPLQLLHDSFWARTEKQSDAVKKYHKIKHLFKDLGGRCAT